MVKKFIYDDSDIVIKNLESKLKKIKIKKDFLIFIDYFCYFINNNINNFNKEYQKNNKIEVDIISLKKISNILKNEMISFEFEDYPSELSTKIKSLKFSKVNEEYIINFLYKIEKEIYEFYRYANFYSEKRQEINFNKRFSDLCNDFKEKFNFEYDEKINKNNEFDNKFKTEIVKIIFSKEDCLDDIKKIESIADKIVNRKNIIEVIKKNIIFLKNRFNKIKKENSKNKNSIVEITDQCLYYLHDKLNSIKSPMSIFLMMKKINKLKISKDNNKKIREIILNIQNLSFHITAFSRERRLWNKSEMENNENEIKKISEEFEILKENLIK